MTHAEIIEALGGSGQVANDLAEAVKGKSIEAPGQSAVSNWIQRGIPYRWRGEVMKLAECKNVVLPDDFLAAA